MNNTLRGEMNMLVLTRRIGEQIVIDANIRVMVIAVNGDKVRLGTSAPSSVTVDRSEVHERPRPRHGAGARCANKCPSVPR